MRKLVKSFAIFAVILGLAGCARTKSISDIHGVVSGSNHTAMQVHDAIMKAGKQRKWIMTDGGAGVINGKVIERGHVAEVRIPYSATSYSIEYVNSQNLRADDGQIHRNYFRWVRNLDKQIQWNLAY